MKYFDMHCDTLYELCHQNESLKDNQKLHINLNKSAHFAHYAQFFAMFCGTAEVEDDADADHRLTALLQTAKREFSENSDHLKLCKAGADLAAAQNERKTAAFLTVEGADLLPDEAALARLGRFIAGLGNGKALDVLPYHTMGEAKYEQLGIPYPLRGTPPMSREGAARARTIILRRMKQERQRLKADGAAR